MPIVNYIKLCERNVSGNMYLFLTEVSNIYSVTVTSGEVSDIVMFGTSTFKEIQADFNTIVRQCLQQGKEDKIYYDHLINFACSNARTELSDLADQLAEASMCGIIAIVMDSNGKGWLVGWNELDKGERPLFLLSDEFTSGKDMTEEDGGKMKFALNTLSGYNDLPMNDTINTYILACVLAGIDVGFTP